LKPPKIVVYLFMSIDKIIPLVLVITGTSFCISGYIMLCISFIYKVSNFSGNKFVLIPPNVFLMIFIGSSIYSLSDLYTMKWWGFLYRLEFHF
jgi:hypothetical protein